MCPPGGGSRVTRGYLPQPSFVVSNRSRRPASSPPAAVGRAAPQARRPARALLGYQILLSLLDRTGDHAGLELYSLRAAALAHELGIG